jgi:hypothetical protein
MSRQGGARSSAGDLHKDPIAIAEPQNPRLVERIDDLGAETGEPVTDCAPVEGGDLDAEVLDMRLLTRGSLLEPEPRVADLKPDA